MVYVEIEAQPARNAERTGYNSLTMDCPTVDKLATEVARSFAHDLWVAEVGLHHRVGSLPSQYDITYTRILSNFVRLVAELVRQSRLDPTTSGDDRSVQVAQMIWTRTFPAGSWLQAQFIEICQRLLQDARASRDNDHTVFADVGRAVRQSFGLPPAP